MGLLVALPSQLELELLFGVEVSFASVHLASGLLVSAWLPTPARLCTALATVLLSCLARLIVAFQCSLGILCYLFFSFKENPDVSV